MGKSIRYSIVIPAFNEAASLPHLVENLSRLLDRLDGTAEVLIVDDGSVDHTYEVARAAEERDDRFRVIRLSRNFGHQVALTAGLEASTGHAVITMDADGQHPLDTVIEMARLWRAGYDVVYGVMTDRPSESTFKRLSSNAFYRLINRVSGTPMPLNAGDFRLMDRQVVEAFLCLPERARYVRGMVSWLGYAQVGVPYSCAARCAGGSTYTVTRMTRLAVDALTSFSTWPLRAGLALGFAISALSLFLGLITIGMRLLSHTVPGWATIVVVVSFLGGAQLTLLGVIGEYVGKIFDEVKHRPLYLLQHGSQAERSAMRGLADPDGPASSAVIVRRTLPTWSPSGHHQ